VFTHVNYDDHQFSGGATMVYQDGYFISSDPEDAVFYHSYGADEIDASVDVEEGEPPAIKKDSGLRWDPLDRSSVEAYPGSVTVIASCHRELWCFKERGSTEILYNTGASDLVFARQPGGTINCGCAAPASVAVLNNSVYWLADDGTIRVSDGYVPTIASTSQVGYNIARYNRIDDAIAIGFSDSNRTFYQITFPSEGETWVYELSAQTWTKRSSWVKHTGVFGRHRANCYARFYNEHIVGDYENGVVYAMRDDAYDDDGRPSPKIRAEKLDTGNEMATVAELEIKFEPGVGIAYGLGSDPQAMLEVSRDGGHTWGNQKWTSIGRQGEYLNRAVWRRLGRARNFVFRVSVTDPVKTTIIGATVRMGEKNG
jgi:hypothetical protein